MTAPAYAMGGFLVILWVTILVAEKLFLTPVLGDAARYAGRSVLKG